MVFAAAEDQLKSNSDAFVGWDGWRSMCTIVATSCCSAVVLILYVSADWTGLRVVARGLSAAWTGGCSVPVELPLGGNGLRGNGMPVGVRLLLICGSTVPSCKNVYSPAISLLVGHNAPIRAHNGFQLA